MNFRSYCREVCNRGGFDAEVSKQAKDVSLYENCPGSRSQNALCTAVTTGPGITDYKGILIDPRSTEEILADELPIPDAPDAMEKTAIRSHMHTETTHMYRNSYINRKYKHKVAFVSPYHYLYLLCKCIIHSCHMKS